MKELLKKKSVQISILLIILLVAIGIVGINVRSAGSRKAYAAHMEAAEKYLSDLDYEQAIAEYTMAFEIEPKEEVVEALEQTYLAYAEVSIDMGDYEKAISILSEGYEKIGHESFQEAAEALEQTYLTYAQVSMDSGDYEKAVSILSEGYAKIERESIQIELAEVTELQEQKQIEDEQRTAGMIEFPFQMTDITVMGYDLSKDCWAQMMELYPIEHEDDYWLDENMHSDGYGTTADGRQYYLLTAYTDYGETKFLDVNDSGAGWRYAVQYEKGGSVATYVSLIVSAYVVDGQRQVFDDVGIHVPIVAGKSYEDWCRVMQIDRIKENNLRPKERDGKIGIWKEDGSLLLRVSTGDGYEHWLFYTAEYQGIYSEYHGEDGNGRCVLNFCGTDSGAGEALPLSSIDADIMDGLMYNVGYDSRITH